MVVLFCVTAKPQDDKLKHVATELWFFALCFAKKVPQNFSLKLQALFPLGVSRGIFLWGREKR
uniref:Uncharacterized protein n=1 Tax=Paracidobacterium acidisoli TaxID=2303751 RepID=A0A372IRX7_9BACT